MDEPRNEWDRKAHRDIAGGGLDRYYEKSGIYEHDAGMSPEEADEQAYRDITEWWSTE